MTLTVARAPLASALAELRRGLHRATTIPILRAIRLAAANGTLTAQATDMDLWHEVAVPCEGHLAACCPDGERIAAAAASAAGETVTLAPTNDRLTLRHEAGRATIACLAADEFPVRPRTEPRATLDVEGADLAALIGRVAHAVSTDQTRYYLNGALLELQVGGGRILLTATDGHRLAHSSCPVAITGDARATAIVPRQALERLARAKGAVRVSLAADRIEAAWEGHVLASRLIDGTYPEWRRVVPQADAEPVILETAALGAAVDRVAWAARDKTSSVWLSINGTGSYVAARGEHDGHEARATLDAASPRRLEGGFNGRYLADLCEAAGGRGALSLVGQVLRLDPEDRPDDRLVVIGLRMTAIGTGDADA
jgi:DNA polymerase-3 subunit beta